MPLPREPELAALAADVNTLASSLADTEARRTRLLGDVAHEMRTPLTALDGYVEGLIDGVFASTPDDLAVVSDELRRLHRLADDLSTLSRAEEQRFDLQTEDADLAEVGRRACERLRPQYEDAGVALLIHADTAVPVQVDVDRITQVLTNLLGNALLATPMGGTVTMSVRREGRRAVASVTDTGVGLTSQDLDRVFERFYRAADRDGVPRAPGSGSPLPAASRAPTAGTSRPILLGLTEGQRSRSPSPGSGPRGAPAGRDPGSASQVRRTV